ncbi:acyltransferase family protein [Dictyobacter formicarum]|uniref:Acyltransferase 3 domain-containing protein n=1 Tax=Dictyobacter formicarum TaxID=2778368 RepID=A0ABQ3VLX8_9CHLR|nr:acyltransferase [Dictyobacter formicarum]GHO87212.1 hypothetical protein KSZ_52180 [Dictyobacter formicarum]
MSVVALDSHSSSVEVSEQKDKASLQTGHKKNIAVLDGVRACAIIAVIMFHINLLALHNLWDLPDHPIASALATFGGSGVTLFFVLSGFLLFMPYAKALLFQTAWPSLRQFYLKRALRIIPAYYIALFVIILFFQRQYLQPGKWKQLALFLTFFMDSSHGTFRKLNGPFWTLAIEWQFYMLLPLLALGFLLLVRRLPDAPRQRLRMLVGCCGLIIIWGLGLRLLGSTPEARTPTSFIVRLAVFVLYGIQGKYLENFAVGMIICLCYTYAWHAEHSVDIRQRLRRASLLLAVIGLGLLFFTAIWHFNVLHMRLPIFSFMNVLTPHFDWLNETVIATGYGACVMAILFGPTWMQRPFAWRPLCWIGFISYGLYMWHLPLLDFFDQRIMPHLPTSNNVGTYLLYWCWLVLTVVPIAVVSYRLIEKPCTQMGARLASKLTHHGSGKGA